MKAIAGAYCVVIAAAFFLCGCNSGLPPDQFARWFEDKKNGFVFEQTIDSFTYSVQYRPADLMTLVAYNADPSIDFSELSKEFNNGWYFKMNICEKDKKKDALKTSLTQEADYFKRVYFLSEGIKQNVFVLLNSGGTLRCALHSYERTYNINPCQTILFSFPKSSKARISKMIFMDRAFTQRPVEFVMSDINKKEFPKLKI